MDGNSMTEHKVTIDNLSLPELVKLYHELGIATQIDYDKFYLYSIITHSTAIEGSTVTELENQLLFDEGITSKGRTLNEQMMNLDLKAAYEWGMKQIKTHPDITTAFLCSLASKVMEHTGNEYNTLNGSFSAAKGELRLLNVTAGTGGKSYLNFMKVPTSIEKFCNELNIRRHKVNVTDIQAIYALSFWAHYHLVTIHPWADGNGRTTRLLMNLLQFEFGVLPMKVTKEEKGDYIQALIDSREQDNDAVFIDVMMHMQERHLRQEIMTFCRSMQDGFTTQVPTQYRPTYRPTTAQVEKLLGVMDDEYHSVHEIMALCGITRRKTIQESYLSPAIKEEVIERLYKEYKHNPNQKYRLTEKGKSWRNENLRQKDN